MDRLLAKPTVGILYPGEMGARLGSLLHEQGCGVVTTLAGRSARTQRFALDADLEVLGSVSEVLDRSTVVLAAVPPAAAVALARNVRSSLPARTNDKIYLDVNSVSPDTVGKIESILADSGMSLVDGAIHGMAAQLPARGTMYLSGAKAVEAAQLFGFLQLKVLGETAGQASAFKMLISGMAKGVVALFLEMSLAARQAGLLDELLVCYRAAYPGIMALVDRLLPTYPQHARRRGDELKEVEETMLSLGLQPCLVAGAQRLTAAVGQLGLDGPAAASASPSVLEVIEEIFAQNPLEIQRESATLGSAPRIPVEAFSGNE